MSGSEGFSWGFFNRLAAPEALADAALAIAREIAAGPSFAHAMTKRMLAMEWAMALDAAIDAEALAQALCMKTADFGRAYHAFANKTKPVFQGD